MNEDLLAQLNALVVKWKKCAKWKYEEAEKEETEFGQRFIRHGGTCYLNAALDLEGVIAAQAHETPQP